MSTIRRQSIISSLIIYVGFAVGMLNTFFFTKHGLFTEEEYGLTTIFVAIAGMMTAFSVLGMPSYLFKFYPYYKDNLPVRQNDMLTWALLISTFGFILVTIAGVVLKNVIIRKFGEHSQLLVDYFYWIFPMGFGLTMYTVLEVYAWNYHKAALTSFLRETQWRLFTTLLIGIFFLNRDFDLFIKLFAFTYPGIAVILFIYLVTTGKVHFTFRPSKVSRRYFGQIVKLCSFVYAGNLVQTISQVFDSIVIAAVLDDGLSKAGIFALAQIMGSVIQAPQRAIVAASTSHLARAWKEKDMKLLQRVYQRSSINLLIFASGIFCLIALNYTEAIVTFGLKEAYLYGFNAFVLLGLTRLVDMGTGMNAQIIATSTRWRFELVSGAVLLGLMVPLTYILTKQFGIIGPAIANLVSVTVYNTIRIIFLWRTFRLFPFTRNSVYATLLAAGCFTVCYFAFAHLAGLPGLVVRSTVFLAAFITGVFYFNLSPDAIPVLQTLQKKFRKQKD